MLKQLCFVVLFCAILFVVAEEEYLWYDKYHKAEPDENCFAFKFKPNTNIDAIAKKFKCKVQGSIHKRENIYSFMDCDMSVKFEDESIIEGGKCKPLGFKPEDFIYDRYK